MEIPQRAELLEFAQRRSSEVLILGVFLLACSLDLIKNAVLSRPGYWLTGLCWNLPRSRPFPKMWLGLSNSFLAWCYSWLETHGIGPGTSFPQAQA